MPTRDEPLFLVTNDDGVLSAGLRALVAALEELGPVLVAAPDGERSGAGHSISFHTHLRAHALSPRRWAVTGTPVDCVYFALLHLCERKPTLVCSGINAGYNLGSDVLYSGTVGAAAEAHLRGISAIAFSADRLADPWALVPAIRDVAERVLRAEQPLLLNVNLPALEGLGTAVVTRLGRRDYHDMVDRRTDPMGRPYFWIGGPPRPTQGQRGEDTWAVMRGLVSITPLSLDMSAPDAAPARALFPQPLPEDPTEDAVAPPGDDQAEESAEDPTT